MHCSIEEGQNKDSSVVCWGLKIDGTVQGGNDESKTKLLL